MFVSWISDSFNQGRINRSHEFLRVCRDNNSLARNSYKTDISSKLHYLNHYKLVNVIYDRLLTATLIVIQAIEFIHYF